MSRQRRCSAQTLSLLAALIEQPRSWQHGYALSKQTGLKSGTLYPVLMRLEEQGLLESSWVESQLSGRPPRHVYRLSRAGVEFAREQLADAAGVPIAAVR
jgi:DNA-binding PadR family transcriptional regulator